MTQNYFYIKLFYCQCFIVENTDSTQNTYIIPNADIYHSNLIIAKELIFTTHNVTYGMSLLIFLQIFEPNHCQ